MKNIILTLIIALSIFSCGESANEKRSEKLAREGREVYWRATRLADTTVVVLIKVDSAFIVKDVITHNSIQYRLLSRVK